MFDIRQGLLGGVGWSAGKTCIREALRGGAVYM
jgi:hypothetical protein